MKLAGMSVEALEALAKRATTLADDLRKVQPSYELALEAGIEDNSYKTVRYGWVASYAGEVEITMADGSKWKAIGHRPRGTAESVEREGYIEFQPISLALPAEPNHAADVRTRPGLAR